MINTRFWIGIGLATISLLIAGGMVVWALNRTQEDVTSNRELIQQILEERRSRIHEQCKLFERREIVAVNRVISTYKLLGNARRDEWDSLLVQTVAPTASKPSANRYSSIYEEAIAERAPKYCNEKRGQRQIGLPETSEFMPRLPKERDYSFMLER